VKLGLKYRALIHGGHQVHQGLTEKAASIFRLFLITVENDSLSVMAGLRPGHPRLLT